MRQTLKWIAMVAILATGAACAPAAESSHAAWGELSAARSVAKVTNLKSLEPGIF